MSNSCVPGLCCWKENCNFTPICNTIVRAYVNFPMTADHKKSVKRLCKKGPVKSSMRFWWKSELHSTGCSADKVRIETKQNANAWWCQKRKTRWGEETNSEFWIPTSICVVRAAVVTKPWSMERVIVWIPFETCFSTKSDWQVLQLSQTANQRQNWKDLSDTSVYALVFATKQAQVDPSKRQNRDAQQREKTNKALVDSNMHIRTGLSRNKRTHALQGNPCWNLTGTNAIGGPISRNTPKRRSCSQIWCHTRGVGSDTSSKFGSGKGSKCSFPDNETQWPHSTTGFTPLHNARSSRSLRYNWTHNVCLDSGDSSKSTMQWRTLEAAELGFLFSRHGWTSQWGGFHLFEVHYFQESLIAALNKWRLFCLGW